MVKKKRGDAGAESSVVIPVLRGAKSVEDKVTFLKSVQNNDSLSDYDRNLVGRVLGRYVSSSDSINRVHSPQTRVFSKLSDGYIRKLEADAQVNWLKDNGYEGLVNSVLKARVNGESIPSYVRNVLVQKAPHLAYKIHPTSFEFSGFSDYREPIERKNGRIGVASYSPGKNLNTSARKSKKRGFMEKDELDESISNRVEGYQGRAYYMGDKELSQKKDIAQYFLSLAEEGRIKLAPRTLSNLRQLSHEYDVQDRKNDITQRVHTRKYSSVLGNSKLEYIPTKERRLDSRTGHSFWPGDQYHRSVSTNGEYDASPGLRKYFEEDKRIQEQPNFQPHNSFDNIKSQRSKTSQKVGVTMAVAGLGASILLIGSNLTGNVIGSLSTDTTNLVGVGAFIIGIVGAMLCFKKK